MTNYREKYKDPKVIEHMLEVYNSEASQAERDAAVEQLAEELGAPKTSVRSKLVTLKVYKAKDRMDKTGKPIIKKSELVDKINAVAELGLSEPEATSLEKASKSALHKILSAFEAFTGADE